MGVGYNPRIVTSNLVFAYDAANPKSLNIPTQADHGWSDWICLVSGTATYSIVDAGVTIYQRTNTGTVSTVVSTSTGPTRGSFTVTAGYSYYSSGGPVNLVCEDAHHAIVPLTMAGTEFFVQMDARGTPITIYVYSPFGTASVNFFNAPASGGLTGTPTTTTSVAAGSSTTFTASLSVASNYYISSNVPVIASITGTGWDKTILSPMSRYVYNRYNNGRHSTTIGTSPSTITEYVIYDSTYNVMNDTVADGSGGDMAEGLGYEFLSNMYSWGNVLSDYTIIAPYQNTNITTYYWDSTNSRWIIWDTHSLSGTQTSPVRVLRDGTNGPGVDASAISGGSINMASGALLWKWESNNPFFLCINDSTDDEFAVLGWRQSTYYSQPRTGNTWINMINGANNLTIVGGAIANNGTITFNDDQVTQYCVNTSFPYPVDDSTMEIWFYKKGSTAVATPITYSVGGDNHQLIIFNNNTNFNPWSLANNVQITISSIANVWTHCVRTRVKATGLESYYINGVLVGTGTSAPGTSLTSGGALIVGQESDAPMASGGGFDAAQNLDGSVGRISIYNRALTAAEIAQNFDAMRGRYGI